MWQSGSGRTYCSKSCHLAKADPYAAFACRLAEMKEFVRKLENDKAIKATEVNPLAVKMGCPANLKVKADKLKWMADKASKA